VQVFHELSHVWKCNPYSGTNPHHLVHHTSSNRQRAPYRSSLVVAVTSPRHEQTPRMKHPHPRTLKG
jgi:hypothetical protein